MADLSIGRRELMRIAAVLGAGATGFVSWSPAPALARSAGHPGTATAHGPYKPVALTREQFAALDTLAEAIIPADDTPGARAAGVAEFIDLMASRDPTYFDRITVSLAWFERESARRFGTRISAQVYTQLDALLSAVAYPGLGPVQDPEGHRSFLTLRGQIATGYYASEVGWRALSNPALADAYAYEDLPGYPHRDDAPTV